MGPRAWNLQVGLLMNGCLFRFQLTVLAILGLGISSSAIAKDPRFKTLAPGLSVTRLKVDLTNIDSLAYGPDGKAYAAAYNGRIHVLTDTNGDGVEDTSSVFWDKAGDLLTPVGILANEDGVYVAARGKIALLKDTDGDGKADKSETVASGWVKEKYNGDTRNDAAGIAIDPDGNLYFSLGCMSYNKAWLLDKQGKSQYDPTSERGAILKVSPDRKRRDLLATGLRFVVGLEFNRHGDLFATDQEGDTWFPGGNPRDELLHIISGRHYGFPFRHAKYLPESIDEPEIVGFSPQHQSTCGFRFNEPRSHRKPFGPAFWQDNAIVTGFSRGKLWRVPLAKTRSGYVGKQVQFLAFESLPTDVAISPAGDLLLTCHSGSPDWGAGPAAKGHLYKIKFDSSVPQPVAVWPANPVGVKVAFDRPVDAIPQTQDVNLQAAIEYGDFVWEGDRHEWIYPGYEVVKAAKAARRRALKVGRGRLSADRRTITFNTAPHPSRTRYAVTLDSSDSDTHVEMSYDLGGVHAQWTPVGKDQAEWTGWLPHFDTNVVRAMMAGSAQHERLLDLLKLPGQLTLKSQLLLPGNDVHLELQCSGKFKMTCGTESATAMQQGNRHVAKLSVRANSPRQETAPRGGRQEVLASEVQPLLITVQTGGDFVLDGSYHADFDPHERPLRLNHLFVPWAPRTRSSEYNQTPLLATNRKLPGDSARGREIFFGKEANCAACHTYNGKGGKGAADLSVSVHRSPEAVLRDIVQPNAAINPDYVSYSLLMADGKVLTGLFQSADDDEILLLDQAAKTHTVRRSEVDDIRASSVSLMPTGFEKLGTEKLQDLVAFLCSEDADAKRAGRATGAIVHESWHGLKSDGLQTLKSHPDFPAKPAETRLLSAFEGPSNWKDNYGSRIRGYVHPPESGDYTFWVAADDFAEVWISSSDDPSKKKRILRQTQWTPTRNWDQYPEQKSKPVRLQKGKRYYIETIHVEGRVDDNLAVGWTLPSGKHERPIPGNRLSAPK